MVHQLLTLCSIVASLSFGGVAHEMYLYCFMGNDWKYTRQGPQGQTECLVRDSDFDCQARRTGSAPVILEGQADNNSFYMRGRFTQADSEDACRRLVAVCRYDWPDRDFPFIQGGYAGSQAYFIYFVCVTGASGFIANHTVKLLLEEGFTVRGTIRSASSESGIEPFRCIPALADKNMELVQADLNQSIDQWIKVFEGCDYVLHIASPFPSVEPQNAEDILKPAVEGTLRVLKACAKVKSVKRVVLTGSAASVIGGTVNHTHVYTEHDWANEKDLTLSTYYLSKVLAEKAAWKFWHNLREYSKFELVVLLPGIVWGPLLNDKSCPSLFWLEDLLNPRSIWSAPFTAPIVDVRDVAKAHLKAMTLPSSIVDGKRFLVIGGDINFADAALAMSQKLSPKGFKIATKVAPYWLLWLISFHEPRLTELLQHYYDCIKYDNSKMKTDLLIAPINVWTTLNDTVDSLIDRGLAVPRWRWFNWFI